MKKKKRGFTLIELVIVIAIIAILISIAAMRYSTTNLKPYLEGDKIPKPAKHYSGATEFTVTAKDDGDVEVSPGILKVENKSLVLDNGN